MASLPPVHVTASGIILQADSVTQLLFQCIIKCNLRR